MKTAIKIFNLLLIVLMINSCDYVSNTIEPNSNNGGNQTLDSTKVYRKVLIEDYTGHRC
jgi:hypothetical protein